MTRARRPSPQTVAVLRALVEEPAAWRYGYELGQQVGLKAGSLYPILIRLTDRGLLESSWETDPPAGRPARHLYRLTGDGIRLATELPPATAARAELPPATAAPTRPPPATAAPTRPPPATAARAAPAPHLRREPRGAW